MGCGASLPTSSSVSSLPTAADYPDCPPPPMRSPTGTTATGGTLLSSGKGGGAVGDVVAHQQKKSSGDNSGPKLRIFSINDVYKLENLAKFQTLLKLHNCKSTPTTVDLVTLNGDLIGGSLLFNLDKGRSIIDVCNHLQVDYMCLGNHEFDHGLKELENRVLEFQGKAWLNTNVRCSSPDGEKGAVLNSMPRYDILEVDVPQPGPSTSSNHGTTAAKKFRIGLVGVCTAESPSLSLQDPTKEGVEFLDPFVETRKILDGVFFCNHPSKKQVDAVIAITHQSNADDEKFLKEFPEISCVLGGHDHIPWRVFCDGGATPDNATSKRIAVKAGLDCEAVDIVEFEFGSTGLNFSGHTFVSLVGPAAENLLDPETGAVLRPKYFDDPELLEKIKQHKKILSLNDFAILDWRDYDTLLTEVNTAAKHESDPWTTKNIRSKQCNFYHLIAKWCKEELCGHYRNEADETGKLAWSNSIMIVNSGQFRANVNYDYSEKLSFTDLQKELAFNNRLMKLRIVGRDVAALLQESEATRKGQGGYLQYDPRSVEVEVTEEVGDAPALTIKSINNIPFSPDTEYTVILVVKMLQGMDNWEILKRYGLKIEEELKLPLNSILDSAPGMLDLCLNHLLKEKWRQLVKLFESTANYMPSLTKSLAMAKVEMRDEEATEGRGTATTTKDITFDDLRKVASQYAAERRKLMGGQMMNHTGTNEDEDDEEETLLLRMMFDLLDVNKDGVVDQKELEQLCSSPKQSQHRGTVVVHHS
ncbi:unnamed protein product [Amoebophrya sp. A120]|nr:unnamed protein product [Amoebophrya sp. A120]|eukprot:GSA120T00009757001.1